MKVELVSRIFPDDPNWPIIKEEVPLGTQYELLGYDREMKIINSETKAIKTIEAYFLEGNGSRGWLPAICFKIIKNESPFNPIRVINLEGN